MAIVQLVQVTKMHNVTKKIKIILDFQPIISVSRMIIRSFSSKLNVPNCTCTALLSYVSTSFWRVFLGWFFTFRGPIFISLGNG